MKRPKQQLIEDVEQLVEKTVVEEALEQVSRRLEDALQSLDAQSEALVREFFAGTSTKDLATRQNLSEEKVEQWLAGARRTLVQELRTKCKVKQ